MKDIECNFIKDLLPLYADGICSDESKALVEEHIKSCDDCKKELEIAKACPTLTHDSEEVDIVEKAGKKLKKFKLKAVIKAVSAAVAVFIVIAIVVTCEVGIYVTKKDAEARAAVETVKLDTAVGTNKGTKIFEVLFHILCKVQMTV